MSTQKCTCNCKTDECCVKKTCECCKTSCCCR